MFDSSTFARLQSIGLTPQILQSMAGCEPAPPNSAWLRVVEVQRDALVLHDGEREHPARALPALIQRLLAHADALAVGDWVGATRNAHGEWWAHARVPPLTQIARRLHDGREKVERVVVAANVDTALLVMGLDHDWNLRRLERYLALVRIAGVGAVVVLTKADLCADADGRRRAVEAIVPQDVAVVALNALADDPARALGAWLGAGRTVVLLGSSGTGKSTLTNALVGRAVQVIGPNRKGDDRGRHTTTSRSLHRLAGGACIVDTPGLRTLRLDGTEGAVAGAFADIATLASACRFRDCRHDGEPGCAVRGSIAPERLHSFRKLVREARRDKLSARERKAQVTLWKERGHAARVHMKAKRG